MILKLSSRITMWTWTGLIWLRMGGSFGRGNELSVCIKCREFLDWLRKY